MRKLLIFIIICISLAFTHQALAWQTICPDPSNFYCDDVGKDAYNATGPKMMREIKLGKIIGVAWRPRGSIIGRSPALPKADLSEQIRLSPRDAYYYIIDDAWAKPFLRQCIEIDAR